jgi:hypothetical protein
MKNWSVSLLTWLYNYAYQSATVHAHIGTGRLFSSQKKFTSFSGIILLFPLKINRWGNQVFFGGGGLAVIHN